MGIVSTLDGEFPELKATIWQSDETVQAAVQSLTPQMTENRKKVIHFTVQRFIDAVITSV